MDTKLNPYVFVVSGMIFYSFKGVFDLDKDETLVLRQTVFKKIKDCVVTTNKEFKGSKK